MGLGCHVQTVQQNGQGSEGLVQAGGARGWGSRPAVPWAVPGAGHSSVLGKSVSLDQGHGEQSQTLAEENFRSCTEIVGSGSGGVFSSGEGARPAWVTRWTRELTEAGAFHFRALWLPSVLHCPWHLLSGSLSTFVSPHRPPRPLSSDHKRQPVAFPVLGVH